MTCALEMLQKLFQPHDFGARNVVKVGNVYILFLDAMKEMKIHWSSHGSAISGDDASDVQDGHCGWQPLVQVSASSGNSIKHKMFGLETYIIWNTKYCIMFQKEAS